MNIKKLIIVTLTSLIVIGCSGEKTQSVEWYLENPMEQYTLLKSCLDANGETDGTPNCQNAFEAGMQSLPDFSTFAF